MTEVGTTGRSPGSPSGNTAVGQIARVADVPSDAKLRFVLTAEKRAQVTVGNLRGQSSNGIPFQTEEQFEYAGQENIQVQSDGGHLEFTVDAGDDRIVDHKSDDEGAAQYSWSFMVKAAWSGGTAGESSEPSHVTKERGPSFPPPAEPEMSPEVSRPWSPTPEGSHIVPEEHKSETSEEGPRPAPSTEHRADEGSGDRPDVTK